ncbi:MAG: hypothetical protein NVSMB26_07180 [Beijerinckiaceae bacterium]
MTSIAKDETPVLKTQSSNAWFHRTAYLSVFSGAPDETLLTYADLAALSGFAVVTLRLWQSEGRGCPMRRVEGRPRFKLGDARRWLAGQPAAEHA